MDRMLYLFVSIAFFLWFIRSVLFWTTLWQLKEYRRDRFFTYIRETTQGRHIIFSFFNFFVLLFLLAYPFVVFNDGWIVGFDYVVAMFLFVQSFIFIKEIVSGTFKRPVITGKALLICAFTLFIGSLWYTIPLIDQYMWLLCLEILTPISVVVAIFFLSFPTELYTDLLMQKVEKLLFQHKKLIVVGISGSYGKSSTVEYAAHILEKKYHVAKTPFFNNTRIAIAKSILSHVTKETQVLLVEMNAYRRGDIEEIGRIVRPDIGIITSISDQHLSLFKKIDGLVSAQHELIECLPKDASVLLNGNSLLTEKVIVGKKQKKISYGTNGKKKPLMHATNIHATKNELRFAVVYRNKKRFYKTHLLGDQHIENILPGIFLAKYLGMKDKEIQSAVATLSPLPKTMKKITLQNGLTLIDDTATASPEAVMAAIKYMEEYKRKRVFILTPLIELGTKAKMRHVEIGRSLARATDIFVTNTNFKEELTKGLIEAKGKAQIRYLKPTHVADFFSKLHGKEDVVVFEGKEASQILAQLV